MPRSHSGGLVHVGAGRGRGASGTAAGEQLWSAAFPALSTDRFPEVAALLSVSFMCSNHFSQLGR